MVKYVTDMKPNEVGVVVRVDGGHGLVRRLETMGVRPGVVVVKRSSQPLKGPITIGLCGTELALGFGIARRIAAEVPE